MLHSPATTVHKEFWKQRLVEIYDHGDSRSLYFGGRFLQSRMSLTAPHSLMLSYTRYMMFSLLLTAELQNVLLVGLGAGSLVRFLHHHFPECTIDAVDHSPHIIKLARGYFQLPDNHRVRIHCQDGEQFLADNQLRKKYDLILVDAFDEKGMSAHIYAKPFFEYCARALQPEGVLCCNLWSGDPQKIAAISAELADCFTSRLLLPVPDQGNVICTATGFPVRWHSICRHPHELQQLQGRFHLDFHKMVQVAVRHNMSFPRRLLHYLSS